MNFAPPTLRRGGTGYAGMTPASKESPVGSCAEARRLIALANQRLRVFDVESASELLQAALDALPQRSIAELSRGNT